MFLNGTIELLSLLKTCINTKSLTRGKLVHQRIIVLGLGNSIILSKNLINLYFSCQIYDSPKHVLNNIENPLDISIWNGLVAAYSKNHMYIEALEVFYRLSRCPYLKPDKFSYPSALKACGGLERVGYGKMIHTQLVKSGLVSDIVVGSSLLGSYGKCGLFGDSMKVFDEMADRDVGAWNTVISCCCQGGKVEESLELFEEMRVSGYEPNSVTLTTVICACARLMDLEKGKEIHGYVVKNGVVLDGFVSSALVDLYGKCGCLEIARGVFEQMLKKTVVAWNSMISGYSLIGDGKVCIELFHRMTGEGTKPTVATLSSILMACSRSAQLQYGKFVHGYVVRAGIEADMILNIALVNLYFNCRKVKCAENVFKLMPTIDIACWNVIISGYVRVGNYFDALLIYDAMKAASAKPDAITFASILPACSQLAALEKGKEIHISIIESGLENNAVVMGALLDMYAKCGAVEEASGVFRILPKRDFISLTCMISAYGSCGFALEALNLFKEMQQSNATPDGIMFLAVLSACSHAGLVEEGYYYFCQMIGTYDIKPRIEHYSCLIDLLGRAGRLKEAYEILKSMVEVREETELLSILFSACCLHKELKLGDEIANILIDKDPNDPSIYVTLLNLYSSLKKWDKACKVRLKMKERGLKKTPGCSWIEIENRLQAFFVEDMFNHGKVYQCLSMLTNHMENKRDNCSYILFA